MYKVYSPEDLSKLKATLSRRILPKLFSQVNSSNAHLKPATLVLSELLTNFVDCFSVSLFATRTGECIFLAATRQTFSKAWTGSAINYPEQDSLKQKFAPITQKIGNWLHKYGYIGPCGVDIYETLSKDNPADNNDEILRHIIVDMNVRPVGSAAIALMRGHFSERRGLHVVSSFSFSSKMTRDSFIDRFECEFQAGKMVILAWYRNLYSGVSYGRVAVAAPDQQQLEKDVTRVQDSDMEILHY